MTTILLTILTALAIHSPTVDVETLDGLRYSGELRALSVENAQVETAEGLKTVPIDRLLNLTFPNESKAASLKGKILVTLVDSSQIVASDYRVQGETAQLSVAGNRSPIAVPTRDVSVVLFSGEPGNLDEAWARLNKISADSDRLVVAKGNSLDYHAGSLGEVTLSRVVFTLDGAPLKVKRQKVFGITYYHPSGRTLPKPLGRLTCVDGTCWPFVSVTMDTDGFKLKTPLGLERSLAIGQVQRLDFAEGKIAYLSDITPESVVWTPYLTMENTAEEDKTEGRATLFGPKFNNSFQAKPLLLDGKQYAKGLGIHSRSVVSYQLDKKYGRLTAMVGIADRVRPRGHVQLKIEADGRVLIDREISGSEAAIPLDLDLAQADRLTITVDFGLQTDIADRLILGDAKVME